MNRQLWLRINGWLFVLLLLAVLGAAGWASARLPQVWQWGGALSRTLSPPSERLLASLEDEVRAYGFATPGHLLQRHLRELFDLYAAASPRFNASVVNPEARPDLVREFGVERAGDIVLLYRGRQERVAVPTEAYLSAALERLLRGQAPAVGFLTGHGERNLLGEANHDLGAFGAALQRKGYRLQPLSLVRLGRVPDDIALLVLTPPQTDLLPGEQAALSDYLERGGNVLWLSDPDEQGRLAFLADKLGVRWHPGVLIDPAAAEALAVDDARLVLVDRYPSHPTTDQLRAPVLLVQAAAFAPPAQHWQVEPVLQAGAGHGLVAQYRPGSAAAATAADGAALAAALQRRQGARVQRIVLAGDGDFLANSYLGNGANLPLGLNLVDWLTQSEVFLDSYAQPAPDQVIELGRWETILLAGGLLFVLPAGFLALGGWRWWRRVRG